MRWDGCAGGEEQRARALVERLLRLGAERLLGLEGVAQLRLCARLDVVVQCELVPCGDDVGEETAEELAAEGAYQHRAHAAEQLGVDHEEVPACTYGDEGG